MRRIIIAAALAACLPAAPALAATVGQAAAVVTLDDAATLEPGSYVWQDTGVGPLSVVVSLPDQRAYVYRGQSLVAVSTISSGKQGRDTPVGSFSILQKETMHHSNLYDDAPMPFMQRLTWDGVALHAGANPGFPASHGCVRLPAGFAKKLFGATRVGTRVSVVDTSIDGMPAPQTPEDVSVASQAETASANEAALAAIASR